LGRGVTIDDIKVALWPGIGVSLTGVTLADDPAFSKEPFVHVADLRVNVKLLPLLKKKVEVKRLVLREPQVTVIVDKDGRRNFDSLMKKGEQGAAEGDAAGSSAGAAAVVLAYADIEDGTVHLVDRAKGIDRTIKAIDFTARDVSLDSEVSFELSAAILSDETDLHIEGKAGPVGEFKEPADLSDVPVDVTLSFGPVAGADALAALPPNPGLEQLGDIGLGKVELTLAVRGTLGAIDIEDIVANAELFGAKEANATVRATVTGINPLAAGGFDPESVNVKGDLDVGPLPFKELGAIAQRAQKNKKASAGPAPELGGTVKAEGAFEGSPGHLTVRASVDGDDATIQLADTFRKGAGVPMRASFGGVVKEKSLDVSNAEVAFNNLVLAGKGTVGAEVLDLTLSAEPTDVSAWGSLVPALAAFSPKGKVSVRARVVGSPAQGNPPSVEGTLTLTDGGATLPQLPSPVHDASATVSFTATSARVDKAAVSVGKSLIHATLDAKSLQPLDATYRVTSDRIFRADFQAPLPGARPTAKPEVLDNVVAEGRIRFTPPGPVDQTGTFTSAKGTVADLAYTDLTATIHSEGAAIVIDRFAAKTLDGTVEGGGRVEPTSVPPTFDIHTSVKQVNLAKYLEVKFPAVGNLIEGRIDLDLSVAGSGKTWDTIAKTLHGSGGAVVVKGALLNVNVANGLLDFFEGLPMVPAGAGNNVRNRNPKLFNSDRTVFENLKGDLKIDNGRIDAGGLVLKAADFTIAGDGWFSFDQTMDLTTKVVFSQKVSSDIVRDIPVTRFLLDSDGRIGLPLTLSGNLLKPQLGLDSNALAARIQQSAVDEGKSKLKGEVEKGVKDLLGGFGKKKDDKKTAPADTTKAP